MFDHVWSLSDLRNQPVMEPTWLIDGWVGHGDAVLLYGEWGSGKTYVLMHMALCLGSGTFFFGAKTQQVRVLYIDQEQSFANANYRFNLLMAGSPHFHDSLVHYVNQPNLLLTPKKGQQLGTLADRYDVIIIDSLRSVLDGDENRAQDIRALWSALLHLKKAGVTTVLTHHMNKEGATPQSLRNRASGNTDLGAGADTALALQCLDERPNRMDLRLSHVKTRWDGKHQPLEFKAVWKTGEWSRFTQHP